VDVGSTFTKAVMVEDGRLIATGSHRTTVETDVLHGLDAAVASTGVKPDEVLVCSSAGGGLRLAVIGYERLVTAEAGHRVGLSAGAKVVHVAAGRLSTLDEIRAARPDVVLLVGGADGGDEETITHNAHLLARSRWRIPVVLAGNAECRPALGELLARHQKVTTADNVLPAIGVLNPGPARAAIREVFLRHVIGGKKLSRGPRFASLVQGATPDIVLTGVELLARRIEGDLLVVDVGGATDGRLFGAQERRHSRGRRHAGRRADRRGRPRDAVVRDGRGGRRGRGKARPTRTGLVSRGIGPGCIVSRGRVGPGRRRCGAHQGRRRGVACGGGGVLVRPS
jgi:uncharacterized protein (TIGR01319 family)